jgi:hypothetical protein
VTDIRKILEESGLQVGSLDRIRLTRGVVGKTSYVAGAALLVLLVAATRASEKTLLAVLIATILVFLAYFIGILLFAAKNPGVALLEGAELIRWRQMEMGVKGTGTLPETENTEPPPQLEGPSN